MLAELAKAYNPQETEDRIYQLWEKSGFFNPDNLLAQAGLPEDRKEYFSIVLPPPNVTGVLHIGHAYEDALQDVVVRYQRMRGRRTLWIPGTDSAAIATQARVEKEIQKKEDKSRHDLGRSELVKRVSDFAKQSETTILTQIRKMGASLDWSRYAYTLDEQRNRAVLTAFKRMYEAGLIYRGKRIVNWDPKGQTVISDDETVHEERTAKLYTFKYSKDFPISIATTRLETKVGDTAVAVHPDDARYKKYIGKEYDAIFYDVPIHIRIVSDAAVDMEFGTGALGVTPAHSHTDWEIAEKNNLLCPQVIDEYAKMIVAGGLNGKKTTEARIIIAEWLREQGLLEKEEDIQQNVSVAERTGGIIEPLPKLQWFIDVDKEFTIPHSEITGIKSGATTTLKQIMRTAVESGDIEMAQENFRKSYFHWIDNLHDWCISRQIWFGHQVPVWYRQNSTNIQNHDTLTQEEKRKILSERLQIHQVDDTTGIADLEIYCDTTPPKDTGWVQDPDVLDTWFSSALWTFSTLGWPNSTEDLKKFHPTSLISPAYEILFLWVSRMILMSGFHLGQVPFKKILIHGLVRDTKGRKFSKSLDNGVDPLDMITKYGADALRMGLLVGTAIGNDVKFDESKVKGYKHFSNKLWNIARFALMSAQDNDDHTLTDDDLKLIDELRVITADITEDMENSRFYLAAEKIYHYVWHTFADKIIEESKAKLASSDESIRASTQKTLLDILGICLKLLHPFMPFVTEEIWSHIPTPVGGQDKKLLIIESWPK